MVSERVTAKEGEAKAEYGRSARYHACKSPCELYRPKSKHYTCEVTKEGKRDYCSPDEEALKVHTYAAKSTICHMH